MDAQDTAETSAQAQSHAPDAFNDLESAAITEDEKLPQQRKASHALYDSPLGTVYLASTDQALVGSWFEGQAHFPVPHVVGERVQLDNHPILRQASKELDEYFEGNRKSFDVPLDPDGTDFQLAVWEALKDIPHGYTTTYGHISKIVGPGAPAQAVGQAVGHNKLSIFIPCHRVLSADGKLTGYAGGIERKQYLLNLESPSAEEEGRLF